MKIKKEVKVFEEKKEIKPNEGVVVACCCCCSINNDNSLM